MPRPLDIHVRLSDRAYEALKDLEEISGFRGSRLVEEVVLAIHDIMENFASLQQITEEKDISTGEAVVRFSSFETAMVTVLSRLGYQLFYEEYLKEDKKAIAKTRQSTEKPSDEKKSQRER